ncbi:MAG: proton-conducting membrane transporter [Spirochaetaceae bacterium]|nr:MAG: proton-conducting membrane transporter [Spirochaetaceae bacterium]
MIPLYVLVLLPIFVATLGYFLPRSVYKHLLIAAQLVHTTLAVLTLAHVRDAGRVVQYLGDWGENIGIGLVADSLSMPLVLLTSAVFLLLFLFNYGKRYMNNTFQFLFIMLQGVTVGLFLAGDIFHVYVLIELSMLTIATLIMYKRDKQALYDGLLYVVINLFGMTFFLLGVGFLYKSLGTLDLTAMAARVAMIENPRSLALPFAAIVSAVCLKAAILPLFSWLPSAHGALSAPSAVSAVLSGLQVKVGLYFLVRLQSVFLPAFDTTIFFFFLGLVTAVVGFSIALVHRDVKLILAFSTVSQVGLILMGLNSGTDDAYWGSVFHIMNHAIFKALLFITAGAITHAAGTRDITRIRNIAPKAPIFALASLFGVLGITGGPFFNGSVSKYLIQAGLAGQPWEPLMYLVNLGTTMVFVKYLQMFLPQRATAGEAHEEPAEIATHHDLPRIPGRVFAMNSVALLMGALCLAGGVFAGPIMELLFGHTLPISGAFYLDKFLIFGGTLVVAVALYYGVVHRLEVLSAVREFRFTFNGVATLFTLFFAVVLTYTFLIG